MHTMQEEEKYLDLIAKYLSGNINDREREALLYWAESAPANQAFFEEMVRLWSVSGSYPEPTFGPDPEKAWRALEPRLEPGKPSSPGRIVKFAYRKTIWRVAAAVLLLLAVGYWWGLPQWLSAGEDLVEVVTLDGEKREVALPDGSTVWVNQNSRLVYPEAFRERSLDLTGEAFFEVVRDESRPFTILTGAVTTTVLGTSFNLRAYPGEENIEVTVKTGKVAVAAARTTARPAARVEVEAGEAAVFERTAGTLEAQSQPIANVEAWRTQSLQFSGTSMAEVLETLERLYGVAITVTNSDILRCTVDAGFSDNDMELSNILEVLELMMDLEINVRSDDPNHYVISGAGCSR